MKMTDEQKKVFDKITTKPKWMKNAVLSERGWKNPETGELLLGRRTPKWVLDVLEAESSSQDVPVVEPEVVVSEPEEVVETADVEVVEVKEEVVEEPVVEKKPAAKKATRKPRKKASATKE